MKATIICAYVPKWEYQLCSCKLWCCMPVRSMRGCFVKNGNCLFSVLFSVDITQCLLDITVHFIVCNKEQQELRVLCGPGFETYVGN